MNNIDTDDQKYIIVEGAASNGSGYEFGFIFLEENKSKLLATYLSNNSSIDFTKDITLDFLNGNILDNKDFNIAYTSNLAGDQHYKNIFDRFFRENLTVDNVLDKISNKGMDSLSKIEKEILDNHSSK